MLRYYYTALGIKSLAFLYPLHLSSFHFCTCTIIKALVDLLGDSTINFK